MRKIFLVFLITMLFNPLLAKRYLKPDYFGNDLIIYAPRFQKDNGNEIYYSRNSRSAEVRLQYLEYQVSTNRAEFSDYKVSLLNNFELTMEDDEDFSLSGERVIYNLKRGYFDASDILIERRNTYIKARRLSFYGNRIRIWDPAVGASEDSFNVIRSVDLSFAEITAYPGLTNGQHILLKAGGSPIFYAYNAVIDERFGPYKIKTPLPEFRKTLFKGTYWQENINFFINEMFYGNVYFGDTEKMGTLYGWEQIIRFDDRFHFYYNGTNFRDGDTEELISFTYLFVDESCPVYFKEAVNYYEERRGQNFPGFALEYVLNSQVQFSMVDIRPHLYGWKGFELPYEFNFAATGGYQRISEYLYDPTADAKVEQAKTARKYYLDLGLSRGLFNFFDLGIDYNTNQYDISPYGWYRISDYAGFGFKIPFTAIKFSTKLTDYLYQQGSSPFEYDKIGITFDSAQLKYKVSFWKFLLIYEDIFNLEQDTLYTSKYHLEYREGVWVIIADYDTREEEFNIGVSISF